MRIALPCYQNVVSGAFQLSQTIAIHDIDMVSASIGEPVSHPFPGVEAAPAWLAEQGVQAVVVGTIDPDHADPIADLGIHVFMGAGDEAPDVVAGQFLQIMIRSLQRREQGGGCCGGAGHDDGSECCGGKGHEDGSECCGGKGHEDGSECCGGKGHADGSECCGGHGH